MNIFYSVHGSGNNPIPFICTLCSSFLVPSIALRPTVAAAALSSLLTPPIKLPVEVFRGVEDLCLCLDALDLPLHQLAVELPAGHQLTVGPLFNYTALVNHYNVVRLLHCAEPMSNYQHCVFLHDVVQSLLNLQ